MTDNAPSSPASRAANRVGIAVLAVLVAALAAWWLLSTQADAGGRGVALVHAADGSVTRLPLDEDAEVTVTTEKGSNTVAVSDGAVRVVAADCDNHDCIRQGSIDAPGRQVICLPHELWIEVVADGEDAPGVLDASAVAGGADAFDEMSR
ncbi:MAG: NusG domain II-containing protein [Eggerthellaceae bacterium]|nr:NusG domain II-containing protein [Eggerthellaceae bacterium]